ncbi:hypothetical protein IEU95_13555 [Hoyosella rhizosphaerae]|uniref:Uncharacterized protein n=1 Tax=Hoyosella rhizosphaerae TaxID=1755582 RepID=A0A916XGL9_9ACTN|nr:hypothetical protein [Hoyosella rhizosphaerae]MBN4927865.1 hypothetical protein [Hoyosella rhizosphaerae]GGC70572.1 hypothetical protein GCM10011410_24280 [Hoyosella rhizosphaerae]
MSAVFTPASTSRARTDERYEPAADDAADIADICVKRCGEPTTWITATELRESLALCLLEVIQATCSDYRAVVDLLDRYRNYRYARTRDFSSSNSTPDGLQELLNTFDEVGGPTIWVGKVANFRRRYSGDGVPVRAASILHIAHILHQLKVNTVTDLRTAENSEGKMGEIEHAWFTELGELTSHAWPHLRVLVGLDEVDSSAAVNAFREQCTPNMDSHTFRGGMPRAAGRLGVSTSELEFTISRWYLSRLNRSIVDA